MSRVKSNKVGTDQRALRVACSIASGWVGYAKGGEKKERKNIGFWCWKELRHLRTRIMRNEVHFGTKDNFSSHAALETRVLLIVAWLTLPREWYVIKVKGCYYSISSQNGVTRSSQVHTFITQDRSPIDVFAFPLLLRCNREENTAMRLRLRIPPVPAEEHGRFQQRVDLAAHAGGWSGGGIRR